MPQSQQPQQSHPQQPESETLEFLKREEVRTMAKDVAKLRAKEATKERERIVSLREIPQSETKTEQPRSQPILQPRETEPKPSLMPHAEDLPAGRQGQKPALPRTKTRPEKILIRVIVIGVLLFIMINGLAFGYWYFTRNQVVEITPSPQPPTSAEATAGTSSEAMAGEAEPGNGNQVSNGNLVAQTPIVFFETPQEKTLELGATDSLVLLLSGALKEEYPQGFTRILVREGDAFLPIRKFLNMVGVVMPEPLLSSLKEDFMLFLYSSPPKKRLGFIAELAQTEGVQDMLRAWGTTLEQDTKPLWEIVGQKGSAYTPFFRQSVYQNNVVRFQTFSVIDFGLVYTLVGTKLILSTSFESATRAVDLLIQSR